MRARIGWDSALAIRGSTRSSVCGPSATLIETGDRREDDASERPSTEYDAFAPYYDAFTAGRTTRRWTSHVLAHARPTASRGDALLDLACGTGKSFLPFLARGFQRHRLRLLDRDARRGRPQGARRARWCTPTSAQLPDARPLRPRHLLRRLAQLPAGRGRARRGLRGRSSANLRAGGLAMFDLNSLRAYRTTFARDSVTERDGMVFAWRGASSRGRRAGLRAPKRGSTSSRRPATGSTARVTTRHAQRHFPRERVEALLARGRPRVRVRARRARRTARSSSPPTRRAT